MDGTIRAPNSPVIITNAEDNAGIPPTCSAMATATGVVTDLVIIVLATTLSAKYQYVRPPATTMVAPLPKLTASRMRKDRKSTRLNSSHVRISYAVFCLKKKKKKN